MELQEFVKETLLEIVRGVKEAQDAVREYGATVNPRIVPNSESAQVAGEYRPVQNVDFEVGLTTSEESENKKGIGVALGMIKAGIDGNGGRSSSAATKIRFTVPLVLPVDASGKENEVKRPPVFSYPYTAGNSHRF